MSSRILRLAMLSVGFGAAIPAIAADSKSTVASLEDIVVTATKREERLMDVPASLVAETGIELSHRGATQLQDIIDNTPGLYNSAPGPAQQAKITIRGVTTGTFNGLQQSTVALLYDDTPVDPGADGAGTTNLRVVDIDHVEVLRGPQGTLFGSGSLSGAIRYVTAKPDLMASMARAEITAATTEQGAGSYNGNLVLNTPLIDGKLAVRSVAYYYNDGGFINDPRTNRGNINSTQTEGARIAARWRPNDRLTADFTLMAQESVDNSSASALDPTPAGGSHFQTDGISETVYRSSNRIFSLNLDYQFDHASLVSNSTYHRRTGRNDGNEYAFVPLISFLASGFTSFEQGAGQATFFVNGDYVTEELRLASKGTGPLRWTVGGFYLNATGDLSQENSSDLVIPYIGTGTMVDLVSSTKQKELAAFGEASYTLGKLELTAGLRASHTTLDYHAVTGGFLAVFGGPYHLEDFHENDKPLTPHYSISYHMNPDTTMYASASRGFRIGGVNITSGVGGRESPKTYGPDNLWNYEVGVKGHGLGGRMAYALSVYDIDWKSIQVSLSNNFGNYTGNAGRAHLTGVEGQLDAHATRWLDVGVSGSWARNKIKEGVDGLITAIGVIDVKAGDRLPAAPQRQLSAFLQGNFQAFGGHDAYARLGAHYVGEAFTGFAGAGSRFGDYTEADLRLGVHVGTTEFIAFVSNLTDVKGKQSALDAQSLGPITFNGQYAYYVRPRTVGLTLRTEF